MVTNSHDVQDYMQPLHINGLTGRMMYAPAATAKKREILMIYGHHALLERWWGLVENLRDFGNVTAPDLPGFGGMDSFYHIGQKPTMDAYADYLAAFVKMKYRRKRVTIVGLSFGFVVATRMLQRYPELASKVDLVVNIVGFMHHSDFKFSPRQRKLFIGIARTLSIPPLPWLIRHTWLTAPVIKNIYVRTPSGKLRFHEVGAERYNTLLDFEVRLWHANDVRTHWFTTSQFLEIDNCRTHIGLPVWHVVSTNDQYFDNDAVEQHMKIVYGEYHQSTMRSKSHTPSIIGDKEEIAVMIPAGLRKRLSRS